MVPAQLRLQLCISAVLSMFLCILSPVQADPPQARRAPSSEAAIILPADTYRGVVVVVHVDRKDLENKSACPRLQRLEVNKALDEPGTLKSIEFLRPPKLTRGPGEFRRPEPTPSKIEIVPTSDRTKLQPWTMGPQNDSGWVTDFTLFLQAEPSPVCKLMLAQEISQKLAELAARKKGHASAESGPLPESASSGIFRFAAHPL